MSDDTICAIASPPGPARRGILRLSGSRARAAVEARVALADGWPERRGLAVGRFDDGGGTQPLLLLWMPGPASYTREDVCELHLPGSPPLLERVLETLLAAGVRRAEPGEFTRRAFLSGRLDLTRAEGVLELIEARTEDERRAASALLEGGLADRVGALRDMLDELRALCEASLDFDETDTGHVPVDELVAATGRARAALVAARSWEEARPPQRGLPRVVLAGAPNAGKSSLFNRLGAGAQAIVSDLSGTTRDPLEATWQVAPELTVTLTDLAGLDRSDELGSAAVPRGAQTLAHRALVGADLILWTVDSGRGDAEALGRELAQLPAGPDRIGVWSQIDRRGEAGARPPRLGELRWVSVSSTTGAGLDALAAATAARLGARPASGSLARELAGRHRIALDRALEALGDATELIEAEGELDLVAGELRRAVAALDEIRGETTPEDLLDRIFARFCIGK